MFSLYSSIGVAKLPVVRSHTALLEAIALNSSAGPTCQNLHSEQ
jgi:hypothetical protein